MPGLLGWRARGRAARGQRRWGFEEHCGASAARGGESPADTGGAGPEGENTGGVGDEQGGAAGAAGEGTAGEAPAGGAPWMEPERVPVCVASSGPRDARKLAISSAEVDTFGGISSDELAIAWTVVSAEQVTLHYASRPDVEADFDAPKTRVLPAASDSVSLSADGLRLVYVNADRKGFTQLVRAATGLPFELEDSRDFGLIREATLLFAADEHVGDPVLGPDNLSFIYSRYGAERSATLLVTKRFSAYSPWPEGATLPVAPELEATEAGRLRPTGVSLDLETLFLWDAVDGKQRIATLAHDTRTYGLGLDLGDARGAAPNAACSRVFYDSAGDLWQADWGPAP